ncbi:DNA mismatch repair protein MutS core [Macrophomina phaseolina MS6]|uniref:DNA mismatch repair protein MutS core n=1 Tax=Macrophomina phaseolina (strain MS6) TaxID=1126212 RepID=K2RXG6_MACPH|nr:DNA mismatch repair protein MutS core [Macrophomina phaseolina MS6]
MKYIELNHGVTFAPHSLRIKYEPSEGSMMIDISTIRALELIQNLENPTSRQCLFGLLNETLTSMGARLLRSNILQPITNRETLNIRYDALEEMSTKEDMFFAVRQGMWSSVCPAALSANASAALKGFLDVDKLLSAVCRASYSPELLLSPHLAHLGTHKVVGANDGASNQPHHHAQTIRRLNQANI